ncbi:hypothetical protein PM082_022656 [Marasmius tenuissimus]|nr:hypothetical protein PM082_022656 [Marasmius tenuissimus]
MRIIGSRAVDEKIRKRQAPAHSKSTRMRVFKDSGEGSNSIAIIREAGGFVYPPFSIAPGQRDGWSKPMAKWWKLKGTRAL